VVKKLVQMFVLVATGAATVKLVDFLKPSLSVPLVAIGALAVGALLLALLEAKYVLPLNWWWHRFWYLRDFRRYARDMQRYETHIADELLKTDALPATKVLVGAHRAELIPYCVSRLAARGVPTPRLLVQGEPGSGKSFAALQIAYGLARAAQWRPWVQMPVLARLDRYRDGSLEAYLGTEVQMTTAANSGKVICDGLDK
jgi:hypothetical protein